MPDLVQFILVAINTLLNGLLLYIINDLRHRITRLEDKAMKGG